MSGEIKIRDHRQAHDVLLVGVELGGDLEVAFKVELGRICCCLYAKGWNATGVKKQPDYMVALFL